MRGSSDDSRHRGLLGLALAAVVGALVVGLALGDLYGAKLGYPFVGRQSRFAIGIYTGTSPFDIHPDPRAHNPVLTAASVKGVKADFVADPYLVHDGSRWYLFCEVWNHKTHQGDIGYATSRDAFHWTWGGIVLDEPFHVSQPEVFKWKGVYYMLPETSGSGTVRLYRSTHLPGGWKLAKILIPRPYVDSEIVHYKGRWWMFTGPDTNDTVLLYYSNSLLGPWKPHPKNPVESGNREISRGAGRALVYRGRLYRTAQDDTRFYGEAVRAVEITKISLTDYSEELLPGGHIVAGTGQGWNATGMHTVDAQPLTAHEWVAGVDGFGPLRVYGWRYLFHEEISPNFTPKEGR